MSHSDFIFRSMTPFLSLLLFPKNTLGKNQKQWLLISSHLWTVEEQLSEYPSIKKKIVLSDTEADPERPTHPIRQQPSRRRRGTG